MLPGFTSVGVGTDARACALAIADTHTSSPARASAENQFIGGILIQLRDAPAKRLHMFPDLFGFFLLILVLF